MTWQRILKVCFASFFICLAVFKWTAAAEGGQSDSLFLQALKTFGYLMSVLALIVVGAWVAKRYLHLLPQYGEKGGNIKILATRTLGSKRAVHLLEIEGVKLLIGSTDNGVSLLKEFDVDADHKQMNNP